MIVLPYLREIRLPAEFDDVIEMKPGEEREIPIELTPDPAFDRKMLIGCSNLMVLNIRGDRMIAVAPGEVKVSIENETRRIRRDFTVRILGAKKKRFGFF